MSSINFQMERLKKLTVVQKETWQGGFIRAPGWVTGEEQKPYRPWMIIWLSIPTKLAHHSEPVLPKEKDLVPAFNTLVDFACNQELAGYLPGKIEVKDTALAEYLEGALAELGIKVVQRQRLISLERLIDDMVESVCDGPQVPGSLRTKGVTIEHMRSFAEAAFEFYLAQPWRHLDDEDLITIEHPIVDNSLRYVSIMGSGGQTYGLSFFDSQEQYNSMFKIKPQDFFAHNEQVWSMIFDTITELPLDDADLWEDYDLPVAGDDAYPVACSFGRQGKFRRPGVNILTFMEGLMRALAQTTEEQMDAGPWEILVETFKGPMTFKLVLQDLLEPGEKKTSDQAKARNGMPDRRALERNITDLHKLLEDHEFENVDQINQFLEQHVQQGDIPHKEPTTPLEKAQDLAYQAFDAQGRKQLLLARQALEICPDCADAYVLLAERTPDAQKAQDLYLEGILAGERALGKEFFEQEAGRFWGLVETRPYMRARLGLAQCLEALDQDEQAADHYREMLRLNPHDNQGVRDMLLSCLLSIEKDEEVEALLKKYKHDKPLAIWSYTKALVSFRIRGDNATYRKHLQHAFSVNPQVVQYLLDEEDLPFEMPDNYGIGSEEEAVLCADQLMDVWLDTPGAADWLEEQATG
ncbi:MAG: hypothetical protein GY869_10225 [Planctomycetes bacterium]|nr:hypothetical protein [Planctomycetota bacterium]